MNQDELISQIFDSMQNSIDELEKSIPSIEKAMFNELTIEMSKLETVNGNIKTSVNNLKQIQKVKNKLNAIILSDDYNQDVNTYLSSFKQTKGLLDDYFTTIVSDFNGKGELFKAILTNSVSITTESLLGAGVSNDIINPISDYLSKSVTSGSNLTELIQDLKVKIIGDKENLGYLLKNVKQIATDSLNQYSANYIKTVSDDLGLKWYKYQGGRKTSSRCFCLERVDKYFHVTEVEYWGETPSLWNTCKTKLHKGGGMIAGTNKTTIFTYRGGWQCNHQIIPVSEKIVPKKDLDRVSINKKVKEEKVNIGKSVIIVDKLKKYEQLTNNAIKELGIIGDISLSETNQSFSYTVQNISNYDNGGNPFKNEIRINTNSKDILKDIRHELRHISQGQKSRYYLKKDEKGVRFHYWDDKKIISSEDFRKINNNLNKGNNFQKYQSLPWEKDARSFE